MQTHPDIQSYINTGTPTGELKRQLETSGATAKFTIGIAPDAPMEKIEYEINEAGGTITERDESLRTLTVEGTTEIIRIATETTGIELIEPATDKLYFDRYPTHLLEPLTAKTDYFSPSAVTDAFDGFVYHFSKIKTHNAHREQKAARQYVDMILSEFGLSEIDGGEYISSGFDGKWITISLEYDVDQYTAELQLSTQVHSEKQAPIGEIQEAISYLEGSGRFMLSFKCENEVPELRFETEEL